MLEKRIQLALICVLCLALGCVSTQASTVGRQRTLPQVSLATPTPMAVVGVAIGGNLSPIPIPDNNPTPAPSDKCENCGGRGKLGDGVVAVECPVCKGTGKRVAEVPKPADVPSQLALATESLQAIYFTSNACPACRPITSRLMELRESDRTIGLGRANHRVAIVNIDTDQGRELADKYQVQSLPTTVIVRGDQEVERFRPAIAANILERLKDITLGRPRIIVESQSGDSAPVQSLQPVRVRKFRLIRR